MTDRKQTIAVFDFDGTITTKDTLFDFIKFYAGTPRLLFGLVAISPILVAYLLKTISNEGAKQEMLYHFFAQEKYADFLKKCDLYKSRVDQIVRKKALDKIKWHQAEGHKVVIVSASVVDWIIPWAKSIGIDEVYGTTLEIGDDDKIVGRLSSKNCYGQEKVNRLLTAYPNREEYTLYMYGDSRGDKELLEMADYPFYKEF